VSLREGKLTVLNIGSDCRNHQLKGGSRRFADPANCATIRMQTALHYQEEAAPPVVHDPFLLLGIVVISDWIIGP
jgi:hypothetical protein